MLVFLPWGLRRHFVIIRKGARKGFDDTDSTLPSLLLLSPDNPIDIIVNISQCYLGIL